MTDEGILAYLLRQVMAANRRDINQIRERANAMSTYRYFIDRHPTQALERLNQFPDISLVSVVDRGGSDHMYFIRGLPDRLDEFCRRFDLNVYPSL